MLAFPSMLISAAQEAGMSVPELDPRDDSFKRSEYPHFHVFCVLQLGRAVVHGEHFQNAITLAKLTADEVKEMTFEKARELGLYP